MNGQTDKVNCRPDVEGHKVDGEKKKEIDM